MTSAGRCGGGLARSQRDAVHVVADELLVVRRRRTTGRVLLGRPVPRRVGGHHLVDEEDLTVELAELELRVGEDHAARCRVARAELVEPHRQVAQLLVTIGADERDRLVGVSVSSCPSSAFVVGVNSGSGSFSASLEARGRREPTDGSRIAVLAPTVAEHVAAHHAFEQHRPRRSHEHRPSFDVAGDLREVGGIGRDHVVGHERRRCWSNHHDDRPVRILPLSGISSASTTSNTETRSLATMSKRSCDTS